MGKRKVKTGCRTCKIRKVKCDETFPVCHKCSSTDRVCDGYGIWGGGNQQNESRHDRSNPASLSISSTQANYANRVTRPIYISLFVASSDDKECFDWFQSRTSVKLKGSFLSDFWSSTVLQASVSELAVRHAVLAVSYVHRKGVCSAATAVSSGNITSRNAELSSMQHFANSLTSLRQHLSGNSLASLRIVLITCIMFASLELLRGHLETARTHVLSGVKLIKKQLPWLDENDMRYASSMSDPVDQLISEILMRLHGQIEIYNIISFNFCETFSSKPVPISPVRDFHSVKEAWTVLDKILDGITFLSNKAVEHEATYLSSRPAFAEARNQKQCIQQALASWLDSYESFRSSHHRQACQLTWETRAAFVPPLHYQMCKIMADICLSPRSEMIFDAYTDEFMQLLKYIANLRDVSVKLRTAKSNHAEQRTFDMSKSITDKGCIAPLYFTAIKCRVHRIRLQAARLLERVSHREGFWDSLIMAAVARKVIQLEEGDYYRDINPTDDLFLLSSSATSWDLSLPTLPESRRLCDIEPIFSGFPVNKVILLCRQKEGKEERKIEIAEYDVSSQSWQDTYDFQH